MYASSMRIPTFGEAFFTRCTNAAIADAGRTVEVGLLGLHTKMRPAPGEASAMAPRSSRRFRSSGMFLMVAPIFFASRTGASYDGLPVTRCLAGDRNDRADAGN